MQGNSYDESDYRPCHMKTCYLNLSLSNLIGLKILFSSPIKSVTLKPHEVTIPSRK